MIAENSRLYTEADHSGPDWTDMIVCYSTIPGYASIRSESSGTWFGYTLAHQIAEHAHEMHLEDILKRVR
jgi:caspase-like apoptosis-related cysteine protease